MTQAKLLSAFKREMGPAIKVTELDPVKVKKFLDGAKPTPPPMAAQIFHFARLG